MKVCDVVIDSIWYDPRVVKQINEYIKVSELSCVGLRSKRYDAEKVAKIPCKVNIIQDNPYLKTGKISIIEKFFREFKVNALVKKAIVQEKPDVIHANDLNALIPAYFAAKKLKCKLVYDSHEIFLENQGIMGNKLQKIYYTFFEKYIIAKCDLMVCVSHAAADYFAKKYNIPKPTVVTNCVSKDMICDDSDKNPGFEVLNHGQFYEGRGYDIMVKAAKLLENHSDISLAIRGFGRMEDFLKNYVAENQITNFRFYPPVTVQELVPMASKSMVGVAITEPVCLNFQLSVSNKIFEYAAAGIPVIMSDIPEHRYLNEKYNIGIILGENTPEAFADAVVKLYEDKALYEECKKNVIKMANEVNWEKDFAKLIEIERSWING